MFLFVKTEYFHLLFLYKSDVSKLLEFQARKTTLSSALLITFRIQELTLLNRAMAYPSFKWRVTINFTHSLFNTFQCCLTMVAATIYIYMVAATIYI